MKFLDNFWHVWTSLDKFGQVQISIHLFGILNFFSVNDVVLVNWLTRGAWDGNAVVCAIKSPSITYIALQWNANGSLKRLFSQSALWYGCNAKNILLPECILLPSDTKNRDGWNTQLFVSLMIRWLWPGIYVKYFLFLLFDWITSKPIIMMFTIWNLSDPNWTNMNLS